MTPQDTKIAELTKRIAELEQEIAKRPYLAHFTYYRGAAFKRDSRGEYDLCVYCPRCFYPAANVSGPSYTCVGCKIMLDVGGSSLEDVICNHVQYVKE